MLWRITSVAIGSAVIIGVIALLIISSNIKVNQNEQYTELPETALMNMLKPGNSFVIDVDKGDKQFYLLTRVLGSFQDVSMPQLIYGLHCKFVDQNNKLVFQHDYYERTKWDVDPKNPAKVRAIVAGVKGVLSMARLTALHVDGILPQGGRIYITPIGKRPVFIRAYRIMQAAPFQTSMNTVRLNQQREQLLKQRLGIDLNTLTPQQQKGIFTYRWFKITMTTPQGVIPPWYRIYFVRNLEGFNQKKADYITIEPFRTIAVNTLFKDLHDIEVFIRPDKRIRPSIQVICLNQGLTKVNIPVIFKEIPDGYWLQPPYADPDCTIYINNPSSQPIQLEVVNKKRKRVLNYGRLMLKSYVVGVKTHGYLEYPLIGFTGMDPLRIRVWAINRIPSNKTTGNLKIELLMSNNKKSIYNKILEFKQSLIDYYIIPGLNTTKYWVSRPQEFFIVPPSGTTGIRITADRDVAVHVYTPNFGIHTPPVSSQFAHWLFKQATHPAWIRMTPINSNSEGYLSLQPRLELYTPSTTPAKKWASCPLPRVNAQTCFEEYTPENPTDMATIESLWCGCKGTQGAFVVLPKDPLDPSTGILTMVFNVRKNNLDKIVKIHKDRNILASFTPISYLGSVRISGISPTTGIFNVQGTDFALFKTSVSKKGISCGRCKVMKAVIATIIPPHTWRRIPIVLADHVSGLNIVTYSHDSQVCLQMSLDNGHPIYKQGIHDAFTFASIKKCAEVARPIKHVWIPKDGRPGIKQIQTIFFPIHDDVGKKQHTLSIYNAGNSVVWFRVFQRDFCGKTEESIKLFDIPFIQPQVY